MQLNTPAAAVRYGLRLVAYAPNGPRLGLLASPSKWDAGFPLNDVASLKLTYSTHAPASQLLDGPCEIAAEYSVDGEHWAEPPAGRFIRIKHSANHADQTRVRDFECPGYAWMLRKIVLYPGPVTVDGKRQFNRVSAGAILTTLIHEAQARGALPGLSITFDSETDSAGQPWDKTLTLAIEPGADGLKLLLNLAEQGVIDWRTQGRILEVVNAGALAQDRTIGPAVVDLRLGRDIDGAPDEGTLEDISSAILVQGEDGLIVEMDNPAAAAPWGRWETHMAQGGVSDEGTARILADIALERAEQERVQVTRSITPYLARWLPLADYKPGDHVYAPGPNGVMSSLRIRQITLTAADDGQIGGNLVLHDRFLERDIRLARRAEGILSGGISSGGSGSSPSPQLPRRTPAAPEGLVIEPDAYIDPNLGRARGQITATWGAVTRDINGVAIKVDQYQLYARLNQPGQVWHQVTATDADDTSATYSPLAVGQRYAFKVRAAHDGTPGVFSDPQTVLIPDDAVPPPKPTAPVLSTRLGVIKVAWDGQGIDGDPPVEVPMPPDFHRVRVWMRERPTTEAIDAGYLTAAGALVVTGQPYGQGREFYLTAVDHSGNESGPSGFASIVTQPLADTDIIGEIIDGANIVDGTVSAADKVIANTITSELIQALAINTDHLQANTVTLDKMAAGSVDAVVLTADAIDGKTVTGAFIRTAADGQRLELAPPEAAVPEMRFYPTGGGGNYTRLYSLGDAYPGEATFQLTSGTNQAVTAQAQLIVAAGLIRTKIGTPEGGDRGGIMDVAEDYAQLTYPQGGTAYFTGSSARVGYAPGTVNDNQLFFDDNGKTKHIGEWDYYNSPQCGLLMGSASVDGAGGVIIGYGPTLSSQATVVGNWRDSPTNERAYTFFLTDNGTTGHTCSVRPNPPGTHGAATWYWWAFRR